jgi:hypothetical protein
MPFVSDFRPKAGELALFFQIGFHPPEQVWGLIEIGPFDCAQDML